MWETVLIATIPTIVISAVSAWVAKILERKKYIQDTLTLEQKNLQMKLETYEMFLTNTNERVQKMTTEWKLERELHLGREAEYQRRVKESDERNIQLEQKINRLIVEVCTKKNCVIREYAKLNEYV